MTNTHIEALTTTEALQILIGDVAANRIAIVDETFGTLLWQVIAHYIRVLSNPSTSDERTPAFHIVALILCQRLIDKLRVKGWSRDERRTMKQLKAVVAAFDKAEPETINLDRLAERIWFAFYGVTRGQAEELAATAERLMKQAREEAAA